MGNEKKKNHPCQDLKRQGKNSHETRCIKHILFCSEKSYIFLWNFVKKNIFVAFVAFKKPKFVINFEYQIGIEISRYYLNF